MTEENKAQALPHNLIMENRNRLTVSGVSDVDSFDEQTVVIFTGMGELTVRGSDLHIINLNVDSGELSVEGTVGSLTYSDDRKKAASSAACSADGVYPRARRSDFRLFAFAGHRLFARHIL